MRENAIVVLQVDVDVQAVDRNARFTIGAGDALDAATIVVAVAALMKAEGVLGRHRAPPSQARELVQDVGDAVAQEQVVVQLTEQGAKGVPAAHVRIAVVADVEERLRKIVEEQPVAVRPAGVVADRRAIDLDQQRDRRVERLRRIERAALAAGRDRRTGVNEIVKIEVGHAAAVLQQSRPSLLAEPAVDRVLRNDLDVGDAVLAGTVHEIAVRLVGTDELCVPVDPHPVGLQIDLDPHRAGIDGEPLGCVFGDTYIDRAEIAVDYR